MFCLVTFGLIISVINGAANKRRLQTDPNCLKSCVSGTTPCASIFADNNCQERLPATSQCDMGTVDCFPVPDEPVPDPTESPTKKPTTTCEKSCLSLATPCASNFADINCFERLSTGVCENGQTDCFPSDAPPAPTARPVLPPTAKPVVAPTALCDKPCVSTALPCVSNFADNNCFIRINGNSVCENGQTDCFPGLATPALPIPNPTDRPIPAPTARPVPAPTALCDKPCVTSALPCVSNFADNNCAERINGNTVCENGQTDCFPDQASPPAEDPPLCAKCSGLAPDFICASIYLDDNCYQPRSDTGECEIGTQNCDGAIPAKSSELKTIENVFTVNKQYITLGFIIGLTFAVLLMCFGVLICKIISKCCKKRHKYKTINAADDSEVTAQSELTTDVHVNEI